MSRLYIYRMIQIKSSIRNVMKENAMNAFSEKTTLGEIALSLLGLNSQPRARKPQRAPRHRRPVPSYMRGVLRHMNG